MVSSIDAPAVGEEKFGGRLGYFIRAGEHSTTPVDWNAFLDFADKWLR